MRLRKDFIQAHQSTTCWEQDISIPKYKGCVLKNESQWYINTANAMSVLAVTLLTFNDHELSLITATTDCERKADHTF